MLTISESSWHYRVYNHWRSQIARKPPRQIDLCHYMRAIILFTPGYYLGLGLLYALIGIAVILAGVFLIVTSPLWGPVWLATHNRSWHKRGARRVGGWLVRRADDAFNWVETGGQWVLLGLLGTLAVVLAVLVVSRVGLLVVGEYLLGVILGIALITAALTGLVVLAGKWWNEPGRIARRKAKREADLERWLENRNRPKAPKEPGWLSLCWSFLKAKKKRICPLIQVNERRTT